MQMGLCALGMPKQHREFKDYLGNFVRLCIKIKQKMKRDQGCSSASEHLPGMWEDHGISPQDWIETPSGMKYHGAFFVILLWHMTDDSLV